MPHGYSIMVSGLENSGRREIFDVVAHDIGLRIFDFAELMKSHLQNGERLDALSPARRRVVQVQAFAHYLSAIGDGYTVLIGRLMAQTRHGLTAGLVDMDIMVSQLRICSWYLFVRNPMKIRELTVLRQKRTTLADYEINPKLIDFEQSAEIAAATDMCRKWSIPLRLIDMELADNEPGYDDFRRKTIARVRAEIDEVKLTSFF